MRLQTCAAFGFPDPLFEFERRSDRGRGVGPWLIGRAVRNAKVDIAETERDLAEDDKVLTLPEG
jgi:hypothetical protein